MELALGLKITKTRDDIASISEYQLAKDKGPVFHSRETNTMFILSAILKGYKRNDIEIKISQDGSKISISGKKPIQEMLMMGWVMHRKEVKITGFNWVFKIPDGVNLDKIKAKYDEEEWSLNIFMPKLVKGIYGVRIEEIKEEKSEDRGKSAQEKNETEHDLSSVGETSQKGCKGFEVQGMKSSESFRENEGVSDKMVDDANREINRETIQNEVETSNLGIDGNGESVREKVGKEGHEVMKTSEQEKNIDVLVSQKLEDRSQDKESDVQKLKESENVEQKERGVSDKKLDDAKEIEEIEETMLRIKDAKVKGMRERDREAEFVAIKASEIEKDVGAGTPQKIGGMKENKSFVEKEKMASDNMLDDANGNMNEVKQRGGTESTLQKMETEETRRILRANSLTEEDTYGEAKQKESGKPKCEAKDRVKERVEEITMERLEEMKTSKLDETVSDHIPENIVGASLKEEFKESRIQQLEKTDSNEGKSDGGVSERKHFEANQETQKTIFGDAIHMDIKKPKIETEDEDLECAREKVVKEEFDGEIALSEKFPKQLSKGTHEESEGIDFTKLKEGKDIKEKMVKRKGKEIEYEGGHQECVREKVCKEGFDSEISLWAEFPKKFPKSTHEDSEGMDFTKLQETKDFKEEMVKRKGIDIEYFVQKGEGEGPKEKPEEAKKDKTNDLMQEVIEKSKNGTKHSVQQVLENTGKGRFDVSNSVTEELPKEVGEQDESKGLKVAKREELIDVIKEAMAETEASMEKVEGEASKKRTEEASLVIEKSTVTEETEDSKIKSNARDKPHAGVLVVKYPVTLRKGKGQHGLQDDMSNERFPGRKAAKEKFPTKKVDSPENTRGGLQDKKIEESKEGTAKQKSVEKLDKTDYVKEEGAEIEQLVKKVREKKYENVQVEEDGGLRKDITRENTHEETLEPKVLSKEKSQHYLHEEMGKGRYEVTSTERNFPMQIADSLGKTREGSKDKEIEESEEIKGDEAKIMSGETEVFESTTKKKIEESQSGRTAQTLQEAPEEKHPKAVEKRTLKTDSQSTKVVGKGLKDVEQGSERDKSQKTKLLPPTIQSKKTHEPKTESVNQGILKPKKSKEEGERQQYTYDKEITKEVAATIEDQVAKPLSPSWFPSTQQSQVDAKDKQHEASKEKSKASLQLKKEDSTKEIKNLIEMKENQESKQKETLKQKIPLGKHHKKGGQVNTKDEFHRGQKEREAMQDETEEPKIKIDGRDQQYVPIDFGKVTVKVMAIENEMPKKEYTQAEPERMETKSGLKETFERDEHTFQNVFDEKPRIQDEILKADTEMVDKAKCIPESMESTKEKEQKEAESLEAISSLPSVESVVGEEVVLKNEIEEIQQKELSPLKAEMESNEPQELQKPTREWKFPKTKFDVPLPESRERERYGYGSEDMKAPKITAYQEELLKQDHGEETVHGKRKGSKFAKSEEAKEASRQLLKGESGKTTQTAEEKKPKMKGNRSTPQTPEFEKASELKQVAEKMHETGKRGHQPEEVTTKMVADPSTPIEITRNKEFKRKEPLELSRPSIENEIPMTKEPQHEKEEERLIHALEQEKTISKEGLAQATKKHSNAKSNAEPKFDIDNPKESMESTEGSTASEVVADKGAQASKFSGSSSTQQQIEVEENEKKDANHEVGNLGSQETKDSKINVQESTRMETEQEVDKIQNLQPKSPEDQQSINKDQEQKHENAEEKAYEQRDEICGEEFQVLEEQKECKEEASGGKKETIWSKKLFVPLVIAGTALLVSLVFVFVRHRRARKR